MFQDYMAIARGSVTHVLIREAQAYADTIEQCTKNEIRLPLHFWILFLMLLIGMSTNPCGGTYLHV